MPRALAAEFLGTGLLVATVVGSGIMAESLAGGNAAIALLGNTLATGAILVVLIAIFAPVSGAHFNPAVSLVLLLRSELPARLVVPYIAAQLIGGLAGTLLAHLMFDLPLLQFSGHAREGSGTMISEIVATMGLIATILGCRNSRPDLTPFAVALFVSAGYWFTASTCFANPAVSIARSLTDTFAGIRPADVPMFILAEAIGAVLALGVCGWLFREPSGRNGAPPPAAGN